MDINKVPNEKYLDWMSIYIEMNIDKNTYVDYVFICNVYSKDPRYKSRKMIIGQNVGLFRIDKKNLDANLLLPMEGDESNTRFYRAVTKILNVRQNINKFPKNAHFACG